MARGAPPGSRSGATGSGSPSERTPARRSPGSATISRRDRARRRPDGSIASTRWSRPGGAASGRSTPTPTGSDVSGAGDWRPTRSSRISSYYVAEEARRGVFVHAGVVGWKGRALVLPGKSGAGKTTLVAELIRAGATYYSDEYAVLDERGRVHPYARPLAVRVDGRRQRRRYPGVVRRPPGHTPAARRAGRREPLSIRRAGTAPTPLRRRRGAPPHGQHGLRTTRARPRADRPPGRRGPGPGPRRRPGRGARGGARAAPAPRGGHPRRASPPRDDGRPRLTARRGERTARGDGNRADQLEEADDRCLRAGTRGAGAR